MQIFKKPRAKVCLRDSCVVKHAQQIPQPFRGEDVSHSIENFINRHHTFISDAAKLPTVKLPMSSSSTIAEFFHGFAPVITFTVAATLRVILSRAF